MNPSKGNVDMTKIDALLDRKTTAKRQVELPEPSERKRLRTAWGLTQQDIATALGVSPSNVGSWEAGRWEPSGEARQQYAYLLGQITDRLNQAQDEEGTSHE